MAKEYDFSKGERGKFYRPTTHLNLPIYLDDEVAELLEKYASKKKSDVQTLVNDLLQRDKELKTV